MPDDLLGGAARRLLDAVSDAQDFRLEGERDLKPTWVQRAQDNVVAIKIAKAVRRQKRNATPAEQAYLARFVGFGATELANSVFPMRGQSCRAGFEKVAADLAMLTEPHEWAALSRSTQYAHYTPEFVIRAMWTAVRRFGFRGGAVLEPGCGIGLFWSLIPDDLAMSSGMVGIEAEPVSAMIAQQLHPRADIRCADFTDRSFRLDGRFTLAIGNPPFSSRTVQVSGISLHEWFILRSIQALEPGGIAAFVVSRHLMDRQRNAARDRIADLADFLGAIRLPSGAFAASAGTAVVVDLVFFRARAAGQEIGGEPWHHIVPSPAGDPAHTPNINSYWLRHPEMVLGEHAMQRAQHGPTYDCRLDDLEARLPGLLAAAVERLGSAPAVQEAVPLVAPAPNPVAPPSPLLSVLLPPVPDRPAALREGSYFVETATGGLFQVVGGVGKPVAVKSGRGTPGMFAGHAAIIRALLPIRDALRDVLSAQMADAPWEQAQVRLTDAYDAFVRRHGPINRMVVSRTETEEGDVRERSRRPNLTPMMDDPDCFLIASIEEYDPVTGIARKGAVFDRRVISQVPEAVIHTPADALAVVLNEVGRVDMERIAAILGCGLREAVERLGDAVYLDPATREWQTDDAYLSGQVKRKLAEAEAAALADTAEFSRNVAALQAVQPPDLLPHEISARLGVPWIEPAEVMQFVLDTMEIATPINYLPEIASWSVDPRPFSGAAARSEWGTAQRHAGQLLEDGLNSRVPQVFRTVDFKDKIVVLDEPATEAAKEKLEKIREAFSTWVWADTTRAARIAATYNRLFNNIVPRRFTGKHLVLPGASNAIVPREHQLRAGWRIVSAGDTYLAHAVGAGKTIALAIGIMEQRRLGLVAKPMLVVPGHCLAQFSREFLQLYPLARILVADEVNFARAKRQRFLARATTGEWDCIIITHSAFQFITVPQAFERDLIRRQLASYKAMTGKISEDDRVSRKRLERLAEGLEDRLKALSAGWEPDGITINEIGIDHVLVDEAQEFRKLSFATNMAHLRGIDPNGSQRAWGLFLKSRFIAQKQPRRSLILSSGTPITNTMGELYTLTRFMAPDLLEERGVAEFDAWAATFGDTRTELELSPAGLYKPVTRFSQFVNVPELIVMFRSVADVVQSDDLRQYVKLPRIRSGQREVVTRQGSAAFKAYQEALSKRIDAIAARKGPPKKGDDIILSVISDGRHAALDMRLVEDVGNEPGNKLNAMVESVFRIWTETSDAEFIDPTGRPYAARGAIQMVFSDIGTIAAEDKRGFSAYRWTKERLVDLGVPAEQIAFMQEHKTSVAKQRLFDACNGGQIRVLIGSSETMGTGVNVQTRLKALHHLDVPWLPSQIEQREGRIVRQGNQNDEVDLYAYATLGSLDASMWQTNERKARFIAAVLSGDTSIRTLDDLESDQAGQFAMAKAIASGDARLMQKAGLEADLNRLLRQADAHDRDQWNIRLQIENAETEIRHCETVIPRLRADLATLEPFNLAQPTIIVGADELPPDEAGPAIVAIARQALRRQQPVRDVLVATICGFPLTMDARFRASAELRGDLLDGSEDSGDPSDVVVVTLDLGLTSITAEFGVHRNTGGAPLLSRMLDKLHNLSARLRVREATLERARTTLADYRPRLGAPFRFAADLEEKQSAMVALNAELAATKKQAAR